MSTHKTFASLLQAQTNRFARIGRDLDRVSREMAYDGWQDHLRLTSGSFKAKGEYARGASRAKNYAKGGSVGRRGSAPLLPINIQTGRLRNSIRIIPVSSRTYDVSIGRGVKYARFILHPSGTRYMVGRGMMGWRVVNKGFPMGELERLQRVRNRAVRDGIKAAWRKP